VAGEKITQWSIEKRSEAQGGCGVRVKKNGGAIN
jgi:hypothetical protein